MTDARTLLDATRLAHALHIAESHCSENAYGCVAWKSFQKRAAKVIETYVSLAGSYPAAEADILRERVAALEGALKEIAYADNGGGWGELVAWLRGIAEDALVPTPATDPRQRPKNVGGPAVAAYFATPAADEARCVVCGHEAHDSLLGCTFESAVEPDWFCACQHDTRPQPTPTEPACFLCRRTKDEHAARPDLLHTFTPEPAP